MNTKTVGTVGAEAVEIKIKNLLVNSLYLDFNSFNIFGIYAVFFTDKLIVPAAFFDKVNDAFAYFLGEL